MELKNGFRVGACILKSAEIIIIILCIYIACFSLLKHFTGFEPETLKRIQSHKGVVATIVVNARGTPIWTTLDNSTILQYAALLYSWARGTVRDIDPQNDLTF
uniref:Roadblock/LAMTOR2 domain-containing protein n=1 Tax=Erpetoichthys calabaricus TaxID=27687 RepID=A0A8C4X8Q7_ERPCA